MILAWTGDELSRGQTSAYRTHRRTDGHTDRQTQATTIPEGQNWPRVKTTEYGIKFTWKTYFVNNLARRSVENLTFLWKYRRFWNIINQHIMRHRILCPFNIIAAQCIVLVSNCLVLHYSCCRHLFQISMRRGVDRFENVDYEMLSTLSRPRCERWYLNSLEDWGQAHGC